MENGARCSVCDKSLEGEWRMRRSFLSRHYRHGRYLGIVDGYFLNSENPRADPNWVYCYCKLCWEKRVLCLSFVPKPNSVLENELAESKKEVSDLIAERAKDVIKFNSLNKEMISMKQQLAISQHKNVSLVLEHNPKMILIEDEDITLKQQLAISKQKNATLADELNSSQNKITDLQNLHQSIKQELLSAQKKISTLENQLLSTEQRYNSVLPLIHKFEGFQKRSKFDKLKEIVRSLSEAEKESLKSCGFESSTLGQSLDAETQKVYNGFIASTCAQLAEHTASIILNLQEKKDIVSSIIKSTQLIMKDVIENPVASATLEPLQLKIESYTREIQRWSRLKEELLQLVSPTNAADAPRLIEKANQQIVQRKRR